MIDVNDVEAKSKVEFRWANGVLLMYGEPYRFKGNELCSVVAVTGTIDEAWEKLVDIENKRTEYIDDIKACV
jgi:hypothetical protein